MRCWLWRSREQGLGRSKGGFTSKIHAKVDALGNPLKIIITAGQRSDITQANALLEGVSNAYVIADKGYAFNKFAHKLSNKIASQLYLPESNAVNP